MARARDLLWFVLLPAALVTVLLSLDFPLALPVEPYADNRVAGAPIVVDPTSNRTSGALLVKAAA